MSRVQDSGLFLVVFLATAFSFFAPTKAYSEKSQVTLSAIANEQTHAAAVLILREAYRGIGHTITFELLPARRALSEANSGATDGDVARISGTEKKFPNLIPVPTPIIMFQAGAFTKTVTKNIAHWSDLKGLTVGIIRGIRYSKIGTEGMDRVVAKDMTHLFRLLDRNRVQVAITVVRAGEIEAAENFPNSGIHLLGKPFYTAPLYHFVHRKNAQLVPLLDAEIKKMSENGLLQELYNRSFDGK